ncbi:MAG: hypothetical protein IJD11_02655 [Oscillospiraceae bacterium]|nr:hypothetical protein [Oscillospiraceae bacterium]
MRKNRFSKTIALALSGVVLFSALQCGFVAVAEENGPEDEATENIEQLPEALSSMDAVQENASFALYCDQTNGNFAVLDKRSGAVWYAFDPDYANAVTVEGTAEEAGSLLKIAFYDKDSMLDVMTSAVDAVGRDQVVYQTVDNGIRFELEMGQKQGESPIPTAISETRMNEMVLSKLEDDWDRNKATSIYMLYTKEDTDPEEYEQLCKKYPLLKTENLYIMREELSDNEIETTAEYFQSVGYTAEDAKEDNEAVGVKAEQSSKPYFKLPLEIILTEDGFRATVDMEQLESNEEYRIAQVTFLEYFGAGRHNTKGELFFPDGSGLMMAYGSDQAVAPVKEVSATVYGENYALNLDRSASVIQAVRMPVYGNLQEAGGYLATVEQGDALAKIVARASDENNQFNTAYTTFAVRAVDEFKFEDWGSASYNWLAFEEDAYVGKLSIHYTLLEKGKASLSDMAAAYRKYLKDTGVIDKPLQEGDIPFYLETLGYYTRKDRFIGIPISRKTPLTTFAQAEEMMEALRESGIKNIALRYLGYANDGLSNTVYNKLNIAGCLGGEQGFRELMAYAAEHQIDFYPDMELSLVAEDRWFDGFIASWDAIRTLDKKYGGWAETRLSDSKQDKETFRYAISADKISNYAKDLMRAFERLSLNSASIGSLGEHLNANFYKRNSINRQNSQHYISEIFESYGEKYDLMTSGGNYYTLKQSSHIVNLPTQDSDYNINGYEVPFVQMALHGYKQYAGVPINLSGEYKEEVLHAVAAGAGIYFVLNCDNTKYLKDSEYSKYYSTRFEDWEDTATEIYQKANAVLSQVNHAEMVGFEQLSDEVTKTVYGNQKAVIVNYSDQAFSYQGKTVEAKSFALVEA